MEGLTSIEQKRLKSLLKGEVWDLVMKFAGLKIKQWQADAVSGENAFQELRALHKRDGKVDGLNEFLEQLEKQQFEA